LVLPMLWIGLYPSPLLRRIEPSVSVLLQDRELHIARSRQHAAALGAAREERAGTSVDRTEPVAR
jgi:hypothetical protein